MSTDSDNDPRPTRFYSVPVSSFYERGGDVSDGALKEPDGWQDAIDRFNTEE